MIRFIDAYRTVVLCRRDSECNWALPSAEEEYYDALFALVNV